MSGSVFAKAVLFFALSGAAFAAQVSPLQCTNAGSTAGLNSNIIDANSCTDYSMTQGLGNWQYGYYGYSGPGPGSGTAAFDPAAFQQMTAFVYNSINQDFWAVDFYHYWTSIGSDEAHPNSVYTDLHSPFCDPSIGNPYPSGTGNCGNGSDSTSPSGPDSVDQDAVWRYVVPPGYSNQEILITLQVQKDPRTFSADGDGTSVTGIYYNGGVPVTLMTINVGPSDPTEYTTVKVINVSSGDILDFAMSAGANDYSDGTFALIEIQAVPEPATVLLIGTGLGAFAFFRRRRQSAK